MAALSMDDFKEAQPSGLSLFNLPPYQSAVERMYYQEVRSNSQLTGNIIDMEITGKHGMEYVDLKRSKLYVKAKITKETGMIYLPPNTWVLLTYFCSPCFLKWM